MSRSVQLGGYAAMMVYERALSIEQENEERRRHRKDKQKRQERLERRHPFERRCTDPSRTSGRQGFARFCRLEVEEDEQHGDQPVRGERPK